MSGCKSLSVNEVSLVQSSLKSSRDLALFTLGVRSGFRISELLSLKVDDVLQQGAVVDRVAVERRHMKGAKQGRAVPLHGEAKQAILKLIADEGLEARHYLFKSRSGANKAISRSQAWRILKDAFSLAGISGKVATHTMRKTFAVQVHEKLGRDILKTQRALGHANINNTVTYLSIDQDEVDAAILQL